MKAAVTSGVGSMAVLDVEEPGEPAPGHVLVRSEAVGICGSDYHFLLGELSDSAGGGASPFPKIQGHECGGTIAALDFRPPNVTLINSLARRPETYHAKLRDLSAHRVHGAQSIHDQTRAKEQGLERWLNYDRWPRHSFRLLLFGRGKSHEDYAGVRLEEDAALAGGRYRVTGSSSASVALSSEDSADWLAEKNISFVSTPAGFDVIFDVVLRRSASRAASVNIAIEVVVNFLAPSETNRYFEVDGRRSPLRLSAATMATELRVVDEWQRAAVILDAPAARTFWIAPIETVSESEDGFERIYQGSQIAAVWPVELAAGTEWNAQLILKAASLS